MTTIQAVFEIGNQGFDMNTAASVATVAAGVVAVIAAVFQVVRLASAKFTREVTEIVREEIAKATQPIQPGYRNGGESLADISHNIARLLEHAGLDKE
jgi:hypothetical protein